MSAVLHPTSEDEAAAAVADAVAARTPLAVEGGGTKAAVGRPSRAERVLSAARLRGITLYEPAELVVGARAGTPLAEVAATLAARGQALPFEPMDHRRLLGSDGEPTLGAVAAANLSGPRRIQAGAARDGLIGVRFVNGRAEVVKNGGRVMKNVTGLDLVKLMAGSWGTLGFLTEVTFKVLPVPETTATVALAGLDDVRAVEALCLALGSPYEVTGAAHLPAGLAGAAGLAGVAGLGGEARTLLRLEGFAASVAYRAGELRTLLRRHGSAEIVETAGLWEAIRDVHPLAEPRERAVWRVSTAPTRGPAVTAALARLRDATWFYDWGGGLIWIATDATGDAGAADLRAALRPSGGHAALVRAPPAVRAAVAVFEPQPEPLMRVQRGIKAALDPHGLFSPGRMHAGL